MLSHLIEAVDKLSSTPGRCRRSCDACPGIAFPRNANAPDTGGDFRCSYGDDPLPTVQEALAERFSAFRSRFMQIRCERYGKDRMLSETYTPQCDMLMRDIVKLMRYAGGGRASKMELIFGIEGAGSQPVRKIVVSKG